MLCLLSHPLVAWWFACVVDVILVLSELSVLSLKAWHFGTMMLLQSKLLLKNSSSESVCESVVKVLLVQEAPSLLMNKASVRSHLVLNKFEYLLL